jgi:hypothetical protein
MITAADVDVPLEALLNNDAYLERRLSAILPPCTATTVARRIDTVLSADTRWLVDAPNGARYNDTTSTGTAAAIYYLLPYSAWRVAAITLRCQFTGAGGFSPNGTLATLALLETTASAGTWGTATIQSVTDAPSTWVGARDLTLTLATPIETVDQDDMLIIRVTSPIHTPSGVTWSMRHRPPIVSYIPPEGVL